MDFSPSHASNLKISPREEAVRKSKKRTPNPCDGLIPLSFLFSMRLELCLKLCVWVILICLKSYSWRRKGYSELDFASVRLSVAVRKYLTGKKKMRGREFISACSFRALLFPCWEAEHHGMLGKDGQPRSTKRELLYPRTFSHPFPLHPMLQAVG